MQKSVLGFVVGVVALASLAGCSNDGGAAPSAAEGAANAAAPSPAPAAAGDKVGIQACDDFAAKVSACGDSKTADLMGKVIDGWKKAIADGKGADVEKKCADRLASFSCPKDAAHASDKSADKSGASASASGKTEAASDKDKDKSKDESGASDEKVGVVSCDAYADKVRTCGNKTQVRLLGKMIDGWKKAVSGGRSDEAEEACKKILDKYKCPK